MAGFILDSGISLAGSSATRGLPSASKSKKRKRTTRSPRKWAPNALPQVKMECGHWQESWPEIRSFPSGFVKVYCDIDGEWMLVVDASKLASEDEDAQLTF